MTNRTYRVIIVGGNINVGFIYAIEYSTGMGLDRYPSRFQAYAEAEESGAVPADDDVLHRRQAVLGY